VGSSEEDEEVVDWDSGSCDFSSPVAVLFGGFALELADAGLRGVVSMLVYDVGTKWEQAIGFVLR
jgi:hypothetical protein